MTDFIIYYPLKVNGKYECTPYSFFGTIEAISDPKHLLNFLKNSFYTESDCQIWINNQKVSQEKL